MIFSRIISFPQAAPDREAVCAPMGAGYVPDEQMVRRIDLAFEQVAGFAQPCYSVRIVPVDAIGKVSLTAGGCEFRVGKVIAPFFRDAASVAVFVATAGVEFGAWLDAQAHSGDILDHFVADAIGSALAERTADVMCADLEAALNAKGLRTGNRYSPGYCGWDVAGQRELFSLLPAQPCGVTLGESCLMTPIKSVSGLIPVGEGVEKAAYGCEICDHAACLRNPRHGR